MIKLFLAFAFITSSIYNISYTDINGVNKSMSTFQGKKLLIVNMATGSSRVSQMGELEQLYQQFHDSLNILAVPSNSFGNESKGNSEIKQFCQSTYNTTFELASKSPVTGSGATPLFKWLTDASENGIMGGDIVGDFQKYLIDKEGNIIGVFSPALSPMDSTIIHAIITQ